jgi:hypothetical protein
LSLLLASSAALGATRLENLVVRPEPAERQVQIEVTIDRGRFDKQACEIMVTPGDDSPPTRLSISIGEAVTRTVRHTYKKDGSYTVRVAAASGCTGTRSASVIVGASPAPAAAAAAAASGSAAASAAASASTAGTLPQAGCPAGWYLVPESVQGARYSCRPHLPPQALKCESGTSYFAEGGVIGCR